MSLYVGDRWEWRINRSRPKKGGVQR